jgi:hypothetical protein
MKNLTNRILILSGGFLVFTIGISYFLYNFNEPRDLVCGTETPQFICGTVSPNLTENAQKGKQIFNVNCAACHHRNKNMVGPALSSINESEFKNWIMDKTSFVEKDSTEYGIKFHRKTFGNRLTASEIEKLIEYSKTE